MQPGGVGVLAGLSPMACFGWLPLRCTASGYAAAVLDVVPFRWLANDLVGDLLHIRRGN